MNGALEIGRTYSLHGPSFDKLWRGAIVRAVGWAEHVARGAVMVRTVDDGTPRVTAVVTPVHAQRFAPIRIGK